LNVCLLYNSTGAREWGSGELLGRLHHQDMARGDWKGDKDSEGTLEYCVLAVGAGRRELG